MFCQEPIIITIILEAPQRSGYTALGRNFLRKGINRDYHNVGQIIHLRGDTLLRRDQCISIESCDREKKDNNRFYSKKLAGNLTQNI